MAPQPRYGDRDAWIDLGCSAILGLLDEEQACVRREIEARLSERYREPDPANDRFNIDPHILTWSLDKLLTEGEVLETTERTRGGTDATTYTPADQKGRRTMIATAAARKRLLYARYRGWAQSSNRYPLGLVGPAGEAAVRAAVLESHTIIPFSPTDAGEVATLNGCTFRGPIDTGGRVISTNPDTGAAEIVNVLIEVKNIRPWLYASTAELWQVLGKALSYQQHAPDDLVLPVVFCRRLHQQTHWMAQRLGFLPIEMWVQYVGRVEQNEVDEVRIGLGFDDLRIGSTPTNPMIDRFRKTLPVHASTYAHRWRAAALNPELAVHIEHLGRPGLDPADRAATMEKLQDAAEEAGMRDWRL